MDGHFCYRFPRILQRLGDTIVSLSKCLDTPYEKYNFYSYGPWHTPGAKRMREIISVLTKRDRINIHRGRAPLSGMRRLNGGGRAGTNAPTVDLSPNTEGWFALMYKSIDPSLSFFPPHDPINLIEIDWAVVEKNLFGSSERVTVDLDLDWEKVICWSGRKDTSGADTGMENLPQCILDKYKGYNFINLGWSPENEKEDVNVSHSYDLSTSLWMLKRCHKYVGIDSGGTWLAMTAKAKKHEDILMYLKEGALSPGQYPHNGPYDSYIKRLNLTGFKKNGEGLPS